MRRVQRRRRRRRRHEMIGHKILAPHRCHPPNATFHHLHSLTAHPIRRRRRRRHEMIGPKF